jgi:hypothetical protein
MSDETKTGQEAQPVILPPGVSEDEARAVMGLPPKSPSQANVWATMAKAATPIEVRFDPHVDGVEVPPELAKGPTAQILVRDFATLRVDEVGLHLPLPMKDAPDAHVTLPWESIWCLGSPTAGEAFFPLAAPLEVIGGQFKALSALGTRVAQLQAALEYGVQLAARHGSRGAWERWSADVGTLLGHRREKPPLVVVPGGR